MVAKKDVRSELLKCMTERWEDLIQIRERVEEGLGHWGSGVCGREFEIRDVLDLMVEEKLFERRTVESDWGLEHSEYRRINVVERIARET